jgi:transposase
MMSAKHGKRYTSRFKFQVVLEVLMGSKNTGQIAKMYGVHPITITHWKKEFIEKGPEIFGQQNTLHEYEKKIQELERLIGHKEVEIALLKNFLAGSSPGRTK